MTPVLAEIHDRWPDRIRVLDLGAMPIENEPSAYAPLVERCLAEVVSIDALWEGGIQVVIGDGGPATFYKTTRPSTSSILQPNVRVCSKYSRLDEATIVVERRSVMTVTLDSLSLGTFDVVKSDLQGADLLALGHGHQTLSCAWLVEIEVDFVEQYESQPRFSEVELFMRSRGFGFYAFTQYGSRPMRPCGPTAWKHAPLKQWMWANAVFIGQVPELESDHATLAKHAVIADTYGAVDVVIRCLAEIDRRDGSSFAVEYEKQLETGDQAVG